MDLDDLLEELLEGVGKARRHVQRAARERVAKQEAARRRQERVRRRLRRAALVGGTVVALVMAAVTALLLLPGSPGVLRLLLALGTGGIALAAGSGAAVAYRAERRDPRSRASRARGRRSRRRRLGAGRTGEELPDEGVLDRVGARSVPRDVRPEWERLVAARRLVQDLAYDGWVEGRALREVDGLVLRLHRLLVADARTTALGGRSSAELRHQVGDLADLLVALADEAVQAQVQDTGTATTVPATLADARDNLRSLRLARREVDRIDRPGGTTATG